MPLLACVWPVAKRRAVVQQSMIVNKLHVAWLKLHAKMENGVIGEFVEQIERLDMSGRQSRRIGKALGAIDILALIETRQETRVPIQHRDFEIWLFALRYLASPVCCDRIKQQRGKIGMHPQHLVINCRRADQQGFTSLHRLANTQQPDHVGRIRVERLSFRRLVNAGVGVIRVGANVADVTENMAGCVLGSCRSEMRTDTAKDRSGEFLAVVRHRKAADELEPNAIDQFVPELLEVGAEAGQRKPFPGNLSYLIGGGEV